MDNQYLNSGEISILDSTTIEISELPVKTWTQVGQLSHFQNILPCVRIVFIRLTQINTVLPFC